MRWLIDGHNLIGRMPDLRLDDPNDEEKLLQHLRRYRAKTGHSITVIFDPGHSYQPGQTKKEGGITIQFAPPGKTADQLIMRRIRKVKNPQAVIVVTSGIRSDIIQNRKLVTVVTLVKLVPLVWQ